MVLCALCCVCSARLVRCCGLLCQCACVMLPCALLLCLFGAGWCLVLLAVLRCLWRVCLPGVVFWWHVLALVSLSGRMAGCPVVSCFGVVCCGVLLPGAACCGAVLPCGVAVLLPLWLVLVLFISIKTSAKKENNTKFLTSGKKIRHTPNTHTQAGSKTTTKYLSYMAGGQQAHYQISVLHVTRRPQWCRCTLNGAPGIQSCTQHWKKELQFSGGVVQICFGFFFLCCIPLSTKSRKFTPLSYPLLHLFRSITHYFRGASALLRCFGLALALLLRCFGVASALLRRCFGVCSTFLGLQCCFGGVRCNFGATSV